MTLATDKTGKALATRQRILSAALELFRERGLETTTMRDIALRAGVAIGAAYYYFQTKDDFLAEHVAALAGDLPALARRLRGRDCAGRLTTFVSLTQSLLEPHRPLLVELCQGLLSPTHPLTADTPAGRQIQIALDQAAETVLAPVLTEVAPTLRSAAPRLVIAFWKSLFLLWLRDVSNGRGQTLLTATHAAALLATALARPHNTTERKLNDAVFALFGSPETHPRKPTLIKAALHLVAADARPQEWFFDTEPSDRGLD